MSYAAVPPSPKKASPRSVSSSASSPLLADDEGADSRPVKDDDELDLDIHEGGNASIVSAVSKSVFSLRLGEVERPGLTDLISPFLVRQPGEHHPGETLPVSLAFTLG